MLPRPVTAPAGQGNDRGAFRDPAFMANRETPVHRWVPWIAGFSRQFVQDALARHLPGQRPGVVLDPFAGVGTTLVEADLAGHEAIGCEINPYAAFAARAKLGAHRLEPTRLSAAATEFVMFMDEAARTGRAPHALPPRRLPHAGALLQSGGRAQGAAGVRFHGDAGGAG